MKFFVLIALLVGLVSCASVKFQNTPGELDANGKQVVASASYFSFMFFAPRFRAADVIEHLRAQCAGKDVSGITVESISRGLFGELVRIRGTGYCVDDS
jgi:hypothetical protein